MDAAFWHERWQQNQIGFHQNDINRFLREYWAAINVPAPVRVLVPLCGKSHDLIWLAQQGYQVDGVELSPLAIQAFFEEQKVNPTRSERAGFQVWESHGLRLWCGDFFQLTNDLLGQVDAIYDRAALIALPPPMRKQYAQHLQVLTEYAPMLLVTLDYDQSRMDGPPFSVPPAEVADLYSGAYAGTTALARQNILDESPPFRERGLDALYESVYGLQRLNK